MNDAFDELKLKAHSLPQSPGVYLYSDANGRVIYVGKARVLRNRVSQYFQAGNTHPKVRAMIDHARSLNYIVTASEYEALVLESSLIKQYQPCYNILLKDSSGRCFIRINLHEAYPRFEIVSRMEADRAEYFGPYFSRELARSLTDSLRTAFHLPVCSRVFPRDIGRERPCLHYQMKQCFGPCRPEAPQELCHSLMEQSAMILRGKTDELEDKIRQEMEAAADALAFERAAELRDQLSALSVLRKKAEGRDRQPWACRCLWVVFRRAACGDCDFIHQQRDDHRAAGFPAQPRSLRAVGAVCLVSQAVLHGLHRHSGSDSDHHGI